MPRHFPRSSLSCQNLFLYSLCPRSFLLCFVSGHWPLDHCHTGCWRAENIEFLTRTAWPNGLRRRLQAPVRKGVPTAVISGACLAHCQARCKFSTPKKLSTKHPKSSRYNLTLILHYVTALPEAPRHFPRGSAGGRACRISSRFLHNSSPVTTPPHPSH